MSHFLPSLTIEGGLAGTWPAPGVGKLLANGLGAPTGVLKGAGPSLKAVFLCVCISAVTFFKSVIMLFFALGFVRSVCILLIRVDKRLVVLGVHIIGTI